MKTTKLRLLPIITLLMLMSVTALAQQDANAHAPSMQSASVALANLPDADMLIYVSPQRILNDAAPKLMPPDEFAKMRSGFADIKKTTGVDPTAIDYLVIALRFHKPGGDLSFQAPDVLAVVGGDFSSDALLTLAQLSLQDKLRQEKHGAKTISLMRVDPIAAQAEKMPLLKSLVEVGAVALNANTLAVGSVSYLKSAIDAAEGTGRINPATLESLMRDPNVLIASTGTPITSLAKAFGLFGTETTPRDSRCDTTLGNFYSAITINGANFSFRGAMNADNPDTAKIISGLLAGLMQQGIDAVPDKKTQAVLQGIKMTPRESEIVWEADVPGQMIADIFRNPPKPMTTEVKTTPRRTVRKKRTR